MSLKGGMEGRQHQRKIRHQGMGFMDGIVLMHGHKKHLLPIEQCGDVTEVG